MLCVHHLVIHIQKSLTPSGHLSRKVSTGDFCTMCLENGTNFYNWSNNARLEHNKIYHPKPTQKSVKTTTRKPITKKVNPNKVASKKHAPKPKTIAKTLKTIPNSRTKPPLKKRVKIETKKKFQSSSSDYSDPDFVDDTPKFIQFK